MNSPSTLAWLTDQNAAYFTKIINPKAEERYLQSSPKPEFFKTRARS